MKRSVSLLLVLILMLSLGASAFADDDILYCRMCGRQIPSDSRLCPYCGEAVVHVGDGTAVKASPQAGGSSATPVAGPFGTIVGTSGTFSGVRVTKSPTSESVPYGGSCIFIAHASNATSITWYIANTDASVIAKASDAPSYVSGLRVSGANSDTLSLSNIPSWMNGYQVQACFEGEGGPVYTDIAKIWTYEEKQENCKLWWWPYRNNPLFWAYYWSFFHPIPCPNPPPPPPPNGERPNPLDPGHSHRPPNGSGITSNSPEEGFSTQGQNPFEHDPRLDFGEPPEGFVFPGPRQPGNQQAEEQTRSQEPLTQEPPTQEPPVQEPPVQQPPVQEPPVQQPPVQQPPVQQPPVQEPPVQAGASFDDALDNYFKKNQKLMEELMG